MKRLVRALSDNVKRYEDAHGQIDEGTPTTMAMPFGGPTGQA
jgi:hypothetical protein